jgi:hypothetical protein
MTTHRTSKTATSWGGHGQGTFGGREATTVSGHAVHHPTQGSTRDVQLGAEPIEEGG